MMSYRLPKIANCGQACIYQHCQCNEFGKREVI